MLKLLLHERHSCRLNMCYFSWEYETFTEYHNTVLPIDIQFVVSQVWEDFVEGQEDEVEEEQDVVDDLTVDRVTDYKEVIATFFIKYNIIFFS